MVNVVSETAFGETRYNHISMKDFLFIFISNFDEKKSGTQI